MSYDMKKDERIQAARDLALGADEMRARGFCKGIEQDGGGRVCAMGAVNIAIDGNPWPYGGESKGELKRMRRNRAAEATYPLIPEGFLSHPIEFNNAPETRQQDVEDLLDDAASLALYGLGIDEVPDELA